LSQEEEELPEPSSFPPELCFMETSIREAEEKYLLDFPERVAPEFQQERDLRLEGGISSENKLQRFDPFDSSFSEQRSPFLHL
jgi:hypothetical protein